jgi:hypothetical protein
VTTPAPAITAADIAKEAATIAAEQQRQNPTPQNTSPRVATPPNATPATPAPPSRPQNETARGPATGPALLAACAVGCL